MQKVIHSGPSLGRLSLTGWLLALRLSDAAALFVHQRQRSARSHSAVRQPLKPSAPPGAPRSAVRTRRGSRFPRLPAPLCLCRVATLLRLPAASVRTLSRRVAPLLLGTSAGSQTSQLRSNGAVYAASPARTPTAGLDLRLCVPAHRAGIHAGVLGRFRGAAGAQATHVAPASGCLCDALTKTRTDVNICGKLAGEREEMRQKVNCRSGGIAQLWPCGTQ
ncbi:unnamed protein product [Tetraodon nigroviridis]|uniref:(spotted green pufferfish) hypothetical protein n=1 Tax=Tetraodon nigroviridis TaxID=99883 RepID=Q4RMZ4_TETNG|nr:unnamed protein product [Tetraodon nigroviridis]